MQAQNACEGFFELALHDEFIDAQLAGTDEGRFWCPVRSLTDSFLPAGAARSAGSPETLVAVDLRRLSGSKWGAHRYWQLLNKSVRN